MSDSLKQISKKMLLGINISVIDQPELLQAIDELVQKKQVALVNNVNVQACNLAVEHTDFRAILNQSEIVFCDGFGVKLGAWLRGIRLGQRMTPPDWIDALFARCVEKKYRIYFLGDTDEVVKDFARLVQERYPKLSIVGWHSGFFELESEENNQVLEAIDKSKTDLILTGMGMPRQERWAWAAKPKLHQGVIIATGALFRWYTDHERRAPKWITASGLEWLARFMTHPIRHFKRYIIGLPRFFWRVIFSSRSRG